MRQTHVLILDGRRELGLVVFGSLQERLWVAFAGGGGRSGEIDGEDSVDMCSWTRLVELCGTQLDMG